MTTKNIIYLTIAALILGYASGRWAAPEKVKIETKTVEVEKKTETVKTDLDQNKHKETVVTEIEKPDGTKEKTTKIVEDTKTDKKTNQSDTDSTQKSETESKEITKSGKRLNISLLGGTSFSLIPPVYGAHVSTSLIGPISCGLWGLSNGLFGASVGINF